MVFVLGKPTTKTGQGFNPKKKVGAGADEKMRTEVK